MKKLSIFNKLIFILNIVVAILTFLAYLLPFLAPTFFPLLSVLTLILPLFLVLNALFFIYWLIQFKRQMLFSGVVLLLGITFITKFYKFSSIDLPHQEQDFVVMSYNVRLFNLFNWMPSAAVSTEIKTFINKHNPDILCIQEYSENADVNFRIYKHRYIYMQGNKIKSGQAIFSKYKIVNSGNLDLPNSDSAVIFIDVLKGKDTLRIYNMHLQSVKITPDVNEIEENVEVINQNKSKHIFKRISLAFTKQQLQSEIIKNHKASCTHPIIICGDMNNSAFSYVYRNVKGNLNDAFEEAGKGFGETYNFKYYPSRIDYILADKRFKVKSFANFSKFKNSDHYPIITRLALN